MVNQLLIHPFFLVDSDTPLIRLTFSLAMISSSAKATFIVLWTKTALAESFAWFQYDIYIYMFPNDFQ